MPCVGHVFALRQSSPNLPTYCTLSVTFTTTLLLDCWRVSYLQHVCVRMTCVLQIKLVNISSNDVVDGNPKLILGLVWAIILHWQVRMFSSLQCVYGLLLHYVSRYVMFCINSLLLGSFCLNIVHAVLCLYVK